MPKLNTQNCSLWSTFLRPNVCQKFASFCQVLKKMPAKENWFLFSASRCRTDKVVKILKFCMLISYYLLLAEVMNIHIVNNNCNNMPIVWRLFAFVVSIYEMCCWSVLARYGYTWSSSLWLPGWRQHQYYHYTERYAFCVLFLLKYSNAFKMFVLDCHEKCVNKYCVNMLPVTQ